MFSRTYLKGNDQRSLLTSIDRFLSLIFGAFLFKFLIAFCCACGVLILYYYYLSLVLFLIISSGDSSVLDSGWWWFILISSVVDVE